MKVNYIMISVVALILLFSLSYGEKKESGTKQLSYEPSTGPSYFVRDGSYGQTFRTPTVFTLSSVTVMSGKYGSPTCVPTMEIKLASAGLPTGNTLTSGTIPLSSITTPKMPVSIEVTPYRLNANTDYILIYSCAGGFSDNSNFLYYYYTSTPTYADGSLYVSPNFVFTDKDSYFELWGTVSTCNNAADVDTNCVISLSEVITYATKWVNNQGVTLTELISSANIWVNGGAY